MDTKKLLDQFLHSGLATGVIAGGLGAAILGRSGIGRDLLKVGGLALVGTLAYQAYQRSKQNQAQVQGATERPGFRDVLQNLPGISDLSGTLDAAMPESSGFGGQGNASQTQEISHAIVVAMISAA